MQIWTEKKAEEFLERDGFPVTRRCFVTNEREAVKKARLLMYPLVVKVSSSKILHKSDVGGVVTNVITEHELKKAFRKLKKIRHCEEVMLQEHVEGTQLLVGIKADELFSHAIAVGTGGVYTEILHDATFRICPITQHDARDMLEGLKIYPILKGARGTPPANLKKLQQFLVKVSKLPKKHPTIKELDINPLFAHQKGCIIADARIIFS